MIKFSSTQLLSHSASSYNAKHTWNSMKNSFFPNYKFQFLRMKKGMLSWVYLLFVYFLLRFSLTSWDVIAAKSSSFTKVFDYSTLQWNEWVLCATHCTTTFSLEFDASGNMRALLLLFPGVKTLFIKVGIKATSQHLSSKTVVCVGGN